MAPPTAAEEAIGRPLTGAALESIEGRRRERDAYSFNGNEAPGDAELQRRLMEEIDGAGNAVLLTYGPSRLAAAAALGGQRRVEVAGLSLPLGARLADKPAVEALLAPLGLRTLGWQRVERDSPEELETMLGRGPIVLRPERSSGGLGVVPCRSLQEVEEAWPAGCDTCGAAPLLENAIPLNTSAAIFADGEIRVHPASLQLIGISSCTDRPLGHCGNDFAAAAELERETLVRLEEMLRAVGGVLASAGYRGAFGLDALLHRDELYFVEVNPRLQGSSTLSAEIATRVGEPGPVLAHLAAHLGLPPGGPGLSLVEWADHGDDAAQLVVYHGARVTIAPEIGELPAPPGGARIFELPEPGIVLEAGTSLARVTLPRSISRTGYELEPELDSYARALRLSPSAPPPGPGALS